MFAGILTHDSRFYPRSPCGERPLQRNADCNYHSVSIHALLAESDRAATQVSGPRLQFLSTLSLRRATAGNVLAGHRRPCFYPRSPCGERQTGNASGIHTHWVSIHALLAESDFLLLSIV